MIFLQRLFSYNHKQLPHFHLPNVCIVWYNLFSDFKSHFNCTSFKKHCQQKSDFKSQKGGDMATFSQRLKTLRKKKFLTQQKLADILEVKRATIAKWESKNAIPDIDTLHKISNYFDVNVDYLVGLTDDKQYPEPPSDNEDDLFNVTAENIYIFTEVAKKEGLSLDLIGKLIQSLSFPKDKEKSLFKTLNIHYEDDNNNSTTTHSNNNE